MYLLTAPLYGEKHLVGLFVIAVCLTVLLIGTKRIEDPKRHKKHILLLMILFYSLEITKLLYMTITRGSFPMNQLPFHLCSLPLYIYPILYFSKSGSKLENFVKPAAFAIVILGAIVALAIPTTIIGSQLTWFPLSGNISQLISFTYHGLMIYSALSLIKTGYYTFDRKHYFKSIITLLPLVLGAFIVNYTLDKDYMFLNTGNGSPLAFIRETSQLLYLSVTIALGFVLIYICFWITSIALNHNKNYNKNLANKNA